MNTNDITKTEDILNLNGRDYDTRHVLNLCEKSVPQSVLDRIEQGCPIETIEEIAGEFPICKYATQITIHGLFPKLSTHYVGSYKNLIRNQNGSVGIRWSAIDNEKRTRLFRKCRICKGFGIVENSTSHYLQKIKAIDKTNAEAVIAEYRAAAEKIDRSLFTGSVSVWVGNCFGCLFAVFQVFVRSFRESDFDALAGSICGMSADEMTAAEAAYAERKRQRELENERRHAEWIEREKAHQAETAKLNAQWLIDNPPPFPRVENHTLAVGDVYAIPKPKNAWTDRDRYDHWEYRKVTKSFGRLVASPVDQDGNKTGEFRYVRGREIKKATGTFYVKQAAKLDVPRKTSASPRPSLPETATGTTVRRNSELNGIEIVFDGIPSEAVRNGLKANGFRWSRYSRCWWHTATPEATAYAERLAANF